MVSAEGCGFADSAVVVVVIVGANEFQGNAVLGRDGEAELGAGRHWNGNLRSPLWREQV